MYAAVVAASGRDQSIVPWIARFEADDLLPGELSDSGRYYTLDVKLASALHANAQGTLSIRINNAADEASTQMRILTGREILALYALHFRMDQQYGNFNSIIDLSRIRCQGDGDVERWLLLWQRMRRNLTSRLSDADLCGMFIRQMKKAPSLQPELSRWKQLPVGHPDKTIAWLEEQTDRWVRESAFEKNRNVYETAVNGRDPLASTPGLVDGPAVPATGRGRERKRRSPSRSRSFSRGSGSARSNGSSAGRKRSGSRTKELCREFAKSGHCRRGDRCRYSHDRGGRARSPRSASPGGRRKASPRHGAAAPGAAASSTGGEPPSDEPCRFWAAGNCPFGDKCKFSHKGPKGTYKKKPPGKPRPASPAAGDDDRSEDDDLEQFPGCIVSLDNECDSDAETVFRVGCQ